MSENNYQNSSLHTHKRSHYQRHTQARAHSSRRRSPYGQYQDDYRYQNNNHIKNDNMSTHESTSPSPYAHAYRSKKERSLKEQEYKERSYNHRNYYQDQGQNHAIYGAANQDDTYKPHKRTHQRQSSRLKRGKNLNPNIVNKGKNNIIDAVSDVKTLTSHALGMVVSSNNYHTNNILSKAKDGYRHSNSTNKYNDYQNQELEPNDEKLQAEAEILRRFKNLMHNNGDNALQDESLDKLEPNSNYHEDNDLDTTLATSKVNKDQAKTQTNKEQAQAHINLNANVNTVSNKPSIESQKIGNTIITVKRRTLHSKVISVSTQNSLEHENKQALEKEKAPTTLISETLNTPTQNLTQDSSTLEDPNLKQDKLESNDAPKKASTRTSKKSCVKKVANEAKEDKESKEATKALIKSEHDNNQSPLGKIKNTSTKTRRKKDHEDKVSLAPIEQDKVSSDDKANTANSDENNAPKTKRCSKKSKLSIDDNTLNSIEDKPHSDTQTISTKSNETKSKTRGRKKSTTLEAKDKKASEDQNESNTSSKKTCKTKRTLKAEDKTQNSAKKSSSSSQDKVLKENEQNEAEIEVDAEAKTKAKKTNSKTKAKVKSSSIKESTSTLSASENNKDTKTKSTSRKKKTLS